MSKRLTTKPDLGKRVWTKQRQLWGNLIPLLATSPFLLVGLGWIYAKQQIFGWGLVILAAFPIVGWLCTNFFGLFQNASMRREMQKRLRALRPTLTCRRYFVGFASPAFTGWLDPHQDVGYLIFHDDKLEFFGDKIATELKRTEITGVRFGPNVHTLLGLGRWVVIDAKVGGKPARMQVELREAPTLLRNRALSKNLKKRLELWLKEK